MKLSAVFPIDIEMPSTPAPDNCANDVPESPSNDRGTRRLDKLGLPGIVRSF